MCSLPLKVSPKLSDCGNNPHAPPICRLILHNHPELTTVVNGICKYQIYSSHNKGLGIMNFWPIMFMIVMKVYVGEVMAP